MRRRMLLVFLVQAIVVSGWVAPAAATHRHRHHRPDLVVASIADPPPNGTTVSSFSVAVSTENVGRAAAKHSVTRVFLSLDAAWGNGDSLVGEVRVPRLRRGAAPHDATIDVAVPASVEPVEYRLLASADANRRVMELNEQNNCTASVGTISFAPPPPPPPPPPLGEGSSQDLIAADLEAGLIDYPTSLQYRTWALFRDLRLPARYNGLPSVGEDNHLFKELGALFDELPVDVQAAIKPYLVPPTDPESAFGPAPALPPPGARASALTTAAAADGPTDTACREPATWRHTDWTPSGGGADDGYRIWVCASSDAEQNLMVTPVVDAASALWSPMTKPEPDGMGKPVPDTVKGNTQNFGNGKIDIMIVYTSECRDRTCPLFDAQDPDGSFSLGAERTLYDTCGAPGMPPKSCSGYITLNAGIICPSSVCANAIKGTLAHETFHVLQDAHNADAGDREVFSRGSEVVWETSWYLDASAEWAAWYYAKDPEAYGFFADDFQPNNLSLLEIGENHEYGSWVWPLLMQRDDRASAVFTSWVAAETATDPEELDDAVDTSLGFATHFRDMSVSNVNPAEYFATKGVGLEADLWQTPFPDFPKDPHIHEPNQPIGVGDQIGFVEVSVLASDTSVHDISDGVRTITIDVGSLENAANADIDVLGRLKSDDDSAVPTWRRVRGSGTKLKLSRDEPSRTSISSTWCCRTTAAPGRS